MLFSLALALGYASPGRMLREMRPSELGMWAAMWAIDPWGGYRSDVGHALVASTVATGLLKKSDGGTFSVADFMPFKEPAPEPDPAQLYAKIAKAFGK